MKVTEVSKEEFIIEMRRQDALGKHGQGLSNDILTDWEKIGEYAEKFAQGQSPFVLVENIELKTLHSTHKINQSLVAIYQNQISLPPPIFVSLTNYSLAKQINAGSLIHAEIVNGNHRVAIARSRNQESLPAYMSRESWNNYKSYLLSNE